MTFDTFYKLALALHAILRICSCRCQNKEADQLHGEHAADQGFYFPFIERKVSVLPVLESSYSHFNLLQPSYMAEQTGLLRASRETSWTGCVVRWRNHKTRRFVNDLILIYYYMIGIQLYYLSDLHISADIATFDFAAKCSFLRLDWTSMYAIAFQRLLHLNFAQRSNTVKS